MGELANILEVVMVICFGISWPTSLYKSYKSRTTEGKSLLFLVFIFIGYIFGIISKVAGSSISYVLFFYILNSIMVFGDLLLYFRNRSIDRINKISKAEEVSD